MSFFVSTFKNSKQMLTKKASKQKSQEDMTTAIDRLSNVKRSKHTQQQKGESKKVDN